MFKEIVDPKNSDELQSYGKRLKTIMEENYRYIDTSNLKLAEYYYDSEDFVNAKNYFDSTLLVLPNTDDRYDSVSRYSNNLTDIAKNIEIITLQDSLLRVAAMSPSEKKDIAARIKRQQEEERRIHFRNCAT